MSRRNRTVPALPGQSRSATCSSKSCGRLEGHKGAHRASLRASATVATKSPVRPDVEAAIEAVEAILAELRSAGKLPAAPAEPKARKPITTEGGVEVLSFDRYTVQPEPKARRTRRPAKQLRCRVVKAGTRCSRAYGHKQAGQRHSFAVVRQLPEAGPSGRDVQTVKGKVSRRSRYTTSGRPSARLA